MSSRETWELCFSRVVFFLRLKYIATVGFHCIGMGAVLSFREIPEGLYGSENVTTACVDTAVSRKWVHFQFWVNFPYKMSQS